MTENNKSNKYLNIENKASNCIRYLTRETKLQHDRKKTAGENTKQKLQVTQTASTITAKCECNNKTCLALKYEHNFR